MAKVEKILLGDGVFAINDVPVGLSRGGGVFTIEREYREIEADGDFGAVKGRIRKIRSVPRLSMNVLTLINSDFMTKFYPAMELDTSGSGVDVLKSALDISESDYIDKVSWTGKTKAGKQVHIEVYNAINMGEISWDLVDKEEVVPEIELTGTYTEADRTTEPFQIEYAKGDTYTVTFTVDDGSVAVEDATITFNNATINTNASGIAVFTGVPVADNQTFTINKGGFEQFVGAVDVVDDNVAQTVSLTSL